MKRLFLVLLLFCAVDLHVAQVFTIPEGDNIYGPVSANVLHKRGGLQFEIVSANFTSARVRFQYSPDGQKTWKRLCDFSLTPKLIPTIPVRVDCTNPDLWKGIDTMTHIRALTTVQGGTVGISKVPNMGSK